jgi:parallel beta-helix repeat protein
MINKNIECSDVELFIDRRRGKDVSKEDSHLIAFIALIFIFSCLIFPVSAKEIRVNDNSKADFASIQEAVNSSSPGDVILVFPGTYSESVDIKIQNISILSKSEDPEDTFVQAFNVSENNITVSGFSVQGVLVLGDNAGYHSHSPIEDCTIKNNILKLGIDADECCNSTIDNNVIFNSGISIYGPETAYSSFSITNNLIVNGSIDILHGPSSSVLLNNTLLNGSMSFIECGSYKIIGNYISNNLEDSGISFWESYSNTIENNTVENCSNGVSMRWLSSQNILKNNTLIFNDKGIFVGEQVSGWNSILNNTVLNSNIGILLIGSSSIGNPAGGNLLLNNIISNNSIGILFEGYSSDNLVTNNKVELNKQYGVYIGNLGSGEIYGSTNQFYNNIFNNTFNFFNDTRNYKTDYKSVYTGYDYNIEPMYNATGVIPIALNTTKTSGTNIIGGPYIGGNYWAKPDGTGFSQTCKDLNGDGIADLPYNMSNDTDFLPLASNPDRKKQ